jgi:copper(I)-binding protein
MSLVPHIRRKVLVLFGLICAVGFALCVPSRPAFAQSAAVKDPWVRTTVPKQKSSSVYMDITAFRTARLVEASSPVAGIVEIHEMRMEKDIMKMRAIPSLDLPSGVRVSLRPGGLHVMLMDLRTHIREGDQIPLSLVIELRDGRRETLEIRALARGPQSAAEARSHEGHDAAASAGAAGASGATGTAQGGHGAAHGASGAAATTQGASTRPGGAHGSGHRH